MIRKSWNKESILSELKSVVEKLGHMPSHQELVHLGYGSLDSGIQTHGGFPFFRELGNFPIRGNPRLIWNDEVFERELLSVSKSIGKMPSNSYLVSINRNDLSSQIARKGGFVEVAKRFGLERDHSDSDTGWDGENKLAEILEGTGFQVIKTKAVKAPFDLLVDGEVKLDVKSANLATHSHVTGWFYRVGKIPQADLIAFFQLDTNDVYLVPWNQCPHTNVTISKGGGKYAKYRNTFDQLRKVVESRVKEREIWS